MGLGLGDIILKLIKMAKIESISLKGCSRKSYVFDTYQIGTNFKPLGVIYCITKRVNGQHNLIYLGITDDLSSRFNKHHKKDCFEENDANCISIHLESSKEIRESIEKDVLCNHNFPCNEINN